MMLQDLLHLQNLQRTIFRNKKKSISIDGAIRRIVLFAWKEIPAMRTQVFSDPVKIHREVTWDEYT